MVMDADDLKKKVADETKEKLKELEKEVDEGLETRLKTKSTDPVTLEYLRFPTTDSIAEFAVKYEKAGYTVYRGSTYLHISNPPD